MDFTVYVRSVEKRKMPNYYCEKCKKTMNEKQFYTSNNREKYPNDGKLNLCKQCATMHIDNWDPQTYTWLLEEIDIPYVPDVWTTTLTKALDSGKKITGLTVVGKYISTMKLSQWKDYRWKDSAFLQEKKKREVEQAMLLNGYDRQAIDKALETSILDLPERPPEPEKEEITLSQEIESQMISDLTEEDKIYLCTQWGKTYRPDEWVRLEELYQQMLASYDIQSAGDLNTLKLACKASLKANQLLDIGDIESAQKATKMYESMMKAGKWTAAQTKIEDNEFIDSIGEIINICEKNGYIERYYSPTPKDHIDRLIQDLRHYTMDLVQNETGLDVMVERAQAQLEAEEQRLAAAKEKGEDAEEEELFNYDENVLETADFAEFDDFLQREAGE